MYIGRGVPPATFADVDPLQTPVSYNVPFGYVEAVSVAITIFYK
jgi:hypothetical protein